MNLNQDCKYVRQSQDSIVNSNLIVRTKFDIFKILSMNDLIIGTMFDRFKIPSLNDLIRIKF